MIIAYRSLRVACKGLAGWRAGFIVANPLFEEEFAKAYGRPKIKKPLANANLRAYFYLWEL